MSRLAAGAGGELGWWRRGCGVLPFTSKLCFLSRRVLDVGLEMGLVSPVLQGCFGAFAPAVWLLWAESSSGALLGALMSEQHHVCCLPLVNCIWHGASQQPQDCPVNRKAQLRGNPSVNPQAAGTQPSPAQATTSSERGRGVLVKQITLYLLSLEDLLHGRELPYRQAKNTMKTWRD